LTATIFSLATAPCLLGGASALEPATGTTDARPAPASRAAAPADLVVPSKPPELGLDQLPAGHPLRNSQTWNVEPTFADEFAADTLNTDNWGTRYPGSDDEFYSQAPAPEVKDGLLRLRLNNGFPAARTNITTGNGAGSVFRQKYGWFEIRAKMPRTPGFSTAFWLWVKHGLAENGGLPGGGPPRADVVNADEVDIFEQFSNNPAVNTHSIHYGPTPNAGSAPGHWAELFEDLHADTELNEKFHVYALEWTPTKLSFYFDDKLLGTSEHPPNIPMHMVIGAGVGNGSPALFDDALVVAYTRVYQLKGFRKGGNQ
jgi:beta-glucanase (GH16 family)